MFLGNQPVDVRVLTRRVNKSYWEQWNSGLNLRWNEGRENDQFQHETSSRVPETLRYRRFTSLKMTPGEIWPSVWRPFLPLWLMSRYLVCHAIACSSGVNLYLPGTWGCTLKAVILPLSYNWQISNSRLTQLGSHKFQLYIERHLALQHVASAGHTWLPNTPEFHPLI